MTDEERRRLEHVEALVSELRDALFEDGPDGSPPLIRRISRLVLAAEHSEWAMVWSIRIVGGLAGLVVSVKVLPAVLTAIGALVSLPWPK